MAEYTDIDCKSPQVAQLVLDYLNREVADVQECESDAPHITAYVEKSTVRVTYHDLDRNEKERHGWDMMLAGFRDGVTQLMKTLLIILILILPASVLADGAKELGNKPRRELRGL